MPFPNLNRFTSGPLVAKLRERNSTMTEADAKQAVARVFDALDNMLDMSADVKVRVANFGTFHNKLQPERTMRHPQTGEQMQVAEKYVVKFKMAKGV